MNHNEAVGTHFTRALMRYGIVYPIVLAVYAVVMHWVYANLISPAYAYLGNRYSPASFEEHLITFLITLITAFTLPTRLNRPSSIMLWIIFTVAAVPTMFMSTYTSYLPGDRAIAFSALVGASVSIAAVMQTNTPRHFEFKRLSSTSVLLVLIVFSVATYGLVIATQGLSLRFLSLLDVYDVRAEYAGEVSQVGILGYLVPIQTNVVNAYFFATGIIQRKLTLTIAAVLGQLVLYSTTGSKHMFFAIVIWILVYLLLRRGGQGAHGIIVVLGSIGVMLISTVVDLINQNSIWTSFFSRRVITVPGALSSAYFQFFSDNPQVHLGHSVLAPFVSYPYQVNPPYVIGGWIANSPNMAANANLFADGYSNFGWAGVTGATLILGIYLRVLDRAAVGWSPYVVGIIMATPAVALTNASVLTSMLTHGLIPGLLLLAFAPLPLRPSGSKFLPVTTRSLDRSRID